MAFNSIFNNASNKIFVMKTVKINNHELKLYDSIDEMPIVNFQKYNKYIIVDSGLGSDIDSVDEHLVNLAKLIKSDKDKEAALIKGRLLCVICYAIKRGGDEAPSQPNQRASRDRS